MNTFQRGEYEEAKRWLTILKKVEDKYASKAGKEACLECDTALAVIAEIRAAMGVGDG